MSASSACPGCYAALRDIDGPTHRYIGASPACWDIYTRLLAGDPAMPTSRWSPLIVDAYAAQHPGGISPQATQSAATHLITLTAIMKKRHSMTEAVELRRAAVEAGRAAGGYPKLDPVPDRWELTVAAITQGSEDTRGELVDRYVEDVLQTWSGLHAAVIEKWYRAAVG